MGIREDLQALRLLRAFLKIRDPNTRHRIVDLVEARIPASGGPATTDPDRKDPA